MERLGKSFIVSLVTLFSCAMAGAAVVTVDQLCYNVNAGNGTATVTQMRDEWGSQLYPSNLVGSVNIPETITCDGTEYVVTGIESNAFSGCDKITSIGIPSTITFMGMDAFNDCTGLTKVNISSLEAWCAIDFQRDGRRMPNSNPLSYAGHIFLNGSEIKELVIPESVTAVGNFAFYQSKGITSVTVGKQVTSVGFGAFLTSEGLENVYWNAVDCKIYTSYDREPLPFCGGANSTIKEFIFGDEVENIPYKLCNRLQLLEKIVIPNSVKNIGEGAFSSCLSLCDVQFGNAVTTIGTSAFNNCTALANVELPESLTTIYETAFYNCTSLASIHIPSSVTHIGNQAFNMCSKLESVHIDDLSKWCHINIQSYNSSPLAIAHKLFVKGVEVKELIIPNDVTEISMLAFEGAAVSSVTIPNSVTSIGASAFYNCSEIKQVYLPESLTRIEKLAFAQCTGITDVYCLKSNPSQIELGNPIVVSSRLVFEDVPVQNAILHVPRGTADLYRAIYEWQRFGTIVDSLEPVEPIEDPVPEGPLTAISTRMTQMYTGSTLQLDVEPAGIEVKWTSSNPAAVTVDGQGLVTAVGPGMAEVVATATGDGSTVWCAVFSKVKDPKMGDVNNDNLVDVGDVNAVIDIILEQSQRQAQ